MEFYSVDTTDPHALAFDDERPPTYNAEDYAEHLIRFNSELAGDDDAGKNNQDVFSYEMGLRQFRSVSDLMSKLMYDLQVSYESFVTEFIRYPNNGVHKLLDLLKVIQLSQTNHKTNSQSSIRTIQSDEFQTLLCLKLCSESEEGALKIFEHSSGLFIVSVCVMSNFSKSRILALQLLTRLCHMKAGHDMVADALSMLRLKFGEPVRFKFLIGMLNSFNGASFQLSCLRFINTFVRTATSAKQQVQIQCELEEAGFDIPLLKMINSKNGASNSLLKEELEIWNSRYIDVNEIVKQNKVLQRDIDNYVDQVKTLMDKIHKMEVRRENDSCEDKDEDKDDDSLFKTKNKITISVSDAQNYNNNNNNNNYNYNSDLKKRKMKKVTKIDLNNQHHNYIPNYMEDFDAIKHMTENKEKQTALSRCKSFLGIKSRTGLEDVGVLEERSRSAEDNFILKTENEMQNVQSRVKRSKSMDIFRRGLFHHQSVKKDLPVLTKSYSHYCKNKIDYVKKWQKDSMQYDMSVSQPKSKYVQNKNKSFYSLYF